MTLFEYICIKGNNPDRLNGLPLKLNQTIMFNGWHSAMITSVELGGIKECHEKTCQHYNTCWGIKSGHVSTNGYIPDLFIHILNKEGTPIHMDAHYICSLLPMDIIIEDGKKKERVEVSLSKLKELNKNGNFCVLCGNPTQKIDLGFTVVKGCRKCEDKLYREEKEVHKP